MSFTDTVPDWTLFLTNSNIFVMSCLLVLDIVSNGLFAKSTNSFFSNFPSDVMYTYLFNGLEILVNCISISFLTSRISTERVSMFSFVLKKFAYSLLLLMFSIASISCCIVLLRSSIFFFICFWLLVISTSVFSDWPYLSIFSRISFALSSKLIWLSIKVWISSFPSFIFFRSSFNLFANLFASVWSTVDCLPTISPILFNILVEILWKVWTSLNEIISGKFTVHSCFMVDTICFFPRCSIVYRWGSRSSDFMLACSKSSIVFRILSQFDFILFLNALVSEIMVFSFIDFNSLIISGISERKISFSLEVISSSYCCVFFLPQPNTII